MGVRTSYKSKHRDQILSILQENEKEHMTAGQILDELRARGMFKGEHGGGSAYVHGKCEKCGKVVHIERKSVEAAMQSLSGSEGNGFELDCTRTLFYGICGDCRRRK